MLKFPLAAEMRAAERPLKRVTGEEVQKGDPLLAAEMRAAERPLKRPWGFPRAARCPCRRDEGRGAAIET